MGCMIANLEGDMLYEGKPAKRNLPKKLIQTYFFRCPPNLAILAYVRPWDPSHWIRNVFLRSLGTGNVVIPAKQIGCDELSTVDAGNAVSN